jgi:lysyl-tRNA synthetase class 2
MSESITKSRLLAWSQYLGQIRQYFSQHSFVEVHTPTLLTSPGSEPYLDFFETTQRWGQTQVKKFLPASPELSLKKLLSYHVGSLYEIRSCFRNQEGSKLHRTEFFLLEWYSVGQNLDQLMAQSYDFMRTISKCYRIELGDFKCYSVAELFDRVFQFRLTPQTSAEELFHLGKMHGLKVDHSWSFDDLFYFLMLERVEPYLKNQGLIFVSHYPPSQAALAQINELGWAERFEIYLNGIELGNAYCELLDPKEYTRRHLRDNETRRALGRPEMPIDPEFIIALEKGLPNPVSGIAFGLERYFMILCQEESIHFWSPLWRSSEL